MMRLIILVSLLLISTLAKGQSKDSIPPPIIDNISICNFDEFTCYYPVYPMPQFPGGQQAMDSFVNANFVMPKSVKDSGLSGKIYVEFLIDSVGRMQNVRLIHNTLDEATGEEAVRVVLLMSDVYTWNVEDVSFKYSKFIGYRYPIVIQDEEEADSEE